MKSARCILARRRPKMEIRVTENVLGLLWVQVLAIILGAAIAVWAADPTIGTWRLNVAKSEFKAPALHLKSEVRTYEESPEGVKVRIRTIEGDGHSVTVEYPANYDGKYYPVRGSGGPADAIALTTINDHEAALTLMHGNNIVATALRVVSKNGRTMTISYKGSDPVGRQVDRLLFYERQ